MLFIFVYILLECLLDIKGNYLESATCPLDSRCTWSYPSYTSQDLKCINNSQCPSGYLCCLDCHYLHRICKIALWVNKTKNLKIQCPKTSIYCKQPFPYLGTSKFLCKTDGECEEGSLCCSDECYSHKLCKKAVDFDEHEDNCPENFRVCKHLLPYEETKNRKCTNHTQCPKRHACCSDSCHVHKICKTERLSFCPVKIRRQSCLNINRTLLKYSCKDDGDCFPGYICCKDNCYDHNVCKLPQGAFTYSSLYKREHFTIPNHDALNNCPKIEEKCTKSYSLRLAKKFICFKDGDCKIGQLCCKDSCVKDFKICKDKLVINPSSTPSQRDYVNTFLKQFIGTEKSKELSFEKEIRKATNLKKVTAHGLKKEWIDLNLATLSTEVTKGSNGLFSKGHESIYNNNLRFSMTARDEITSSSIFNEMRCSSIPLIFTTSQK